MPDHCQHMADYWREMFNYTFSFEAPEYGDDLKRILAFCEGRHDYYIQKAQQ